MGKIKLKRPLWNGKEGDELEVSAEREYWAVNRGYAEPVMEEIKANIKPVVEEIKAKVEPVVRKKKIESGLKSRQKK